MATHSCYPTIQKKSLKDLNGKPKAKAHAFRQWVGKYNSLQLLSSTYQRYFGYSITARLFRAFLLLGYTCASTRACICLCIYVFIYIYTLHALSSRKYPVPKGPFAVTPEDPPGLQTHASTDLLGEALWSTRSPMELVGNSPPRPGISDSRSDRQQVQQAWHLQQLSLRTPVTAAQDSNTDKILPNKEWSFSFSSLESTQHLRGGSARTYICTYVPTSFWHPLSIPQPGEQGSATQAVLFPHLSVGQTSWPRAASWSPAPSPRLEMRASVIQTVMPDCSVKKILIKKQRVALPVCFAVALCGSSSTASDPKPTTRKMHIIHTQKYFTFHLVFHIFHSHCPSALSSSTLLSIFSLT